jgi:hypothetical protein
MKTEQTIWILAVRHKTPCSKRDVEYEQILSSFSCHRVTSITSSLGRDADKHLVVSIAHMGCPSEEITLMS